MFTRIDQAAIIELVRRMILTSPNVGGNVGGKFPITGLGLWFGTITDPNPYFSMDFGSLTDPSNLFIDMGEF